jgi:DNA polymerase-3 subunit alpha
MGVSVGPGRGSAAGSAVAYCLGITNIDPIRYDLLFERFLNPERISMPDIDIDFDDEGRAKVIDYVINKYGHDQVAQIITYGTMAAKLSVRDVGRVLGLELPLVDQITKAFPSHLGATLNAVLAEGDVDEKLKEKLNPEDLEKAYKIREMAAGDDLIGETIRTAMELEGSVRNTGIHACGVIITPDEITNYVPVSKPKDSELWVSQFDNSVAEDAGLLKMDFLGLRTLSIIKDAVKIIVERHGIQLDVDDLPLDDEKTYELFQRGDTIGIFQYESVGMQRYLRELQPTRFEDLIAMNALFRPGPMAYIPNFIARKHGREKITYDLPDMEEYLAETYGITVYQEQVMLLSQKLAGFTKGQADALRKGMGKKKKAIIDELYPKFIEGCLKNGHPKEIVDKIWSDWESFASYAFNKSHSTCYAFVAFQTAFLKAHYPAEFMASVLTHNKNDITKVNFFLREAKKLDIEVLGPDINESVSYFTVNNNGQIRIGLSAMKGVGEGPVEEIVREREENGQFNSFYDFFKRVNLRIVNKKCLESLAQGGALDSLGLHRSQYFAPTPQYQTLIEQGLRFGNAYQAHQAQQANSLFGDTGVELISEPPIPESDEWPLIEKLEKEKEVIGIYISGHPLDMHAMEMKHFTSCEIRKLKEVMKDGLSAQVAGIVSSARHAVNQRGEGYCRFSLQDYNDSLDLGLYREEYQKFGALIKEGQVIFIDLTIQKRYNSEDLYFRPKEVRLLSSVSEQRTESITLKLTTQMLSDRMINDISDLCNAFQGKHDLKMVLVGQDDVMINLKSRGLKVNADSTFVERLAKLGVSYRLN